MSGAKNFVKLCGSSVKLRDTTHELANPPLHELANTFSYPSVNNSLKNSIVMGKPLLKLNCGS